VFSQVQQVLDELTPLIESVGVEATLIDAIDGVVTVALAKSDVQANPDMQRLRGFIEREIMDEVPVAKQVVFQGELAEPVQAAVPAKPRSGIKIDIVQPDESVDTCIVTLDQVVGPATTVMFENETDAEDWPLMRELIVLEGVDALMVQDKMIIITRVEKTWAELVPVCAEVIRRHFGDQVPNDLRERVQRVLDADINPAVSAHGGNIELLDIKGTEVFVHMGGGCQGCGQAALTLKHGVQTSIIEAVPEVTAVYDTTDHAAGTNPFYRGTY
jgi:Fe-S cluster biogenesis protein NfuA